LSLFFHSDRPRMAGILLALYAAYLVVVNRIPPKDHEEIEDVAEVARFVIQLRPVHRRIAILAMFAVGGTVLYLVAHPFLTSMNGPAPVPGSTPTGRGRDSPRATA